MTIKKMNAISDHELQKISSFFYEKSGILLGQDKKHLIVGRLANRSMSLGLSTAEYIHQVIASPHSAEASVLVDLLTTNETYFFREPQHFEHLKWVASQSKHSTFRVWSSACSSGEEAYSAGMVLSRSVGIGSTWEVIGTDLSGRMIQHAQTGLYVADRCKQIPIDDLKKWCLKGEGTYTGQVLIRKELKSKIHFSLGNLLESQNNLGGFDVIFLRNVLIYFKEAEKHLIINNILAHLKRNGFLYTGHAESMRGFENGLTRIRPAIYQKQ